MDRGSWQATVHRAIKNQTWLKWLSMHASVCRWTGYLCAWVGVKRAFLVGTLLSNSAGILSWENLPPVPSITSRVLNMIVDSSFSQCWEKFKGIRSHMWGFLRSKFRAVVPVCFCFISLTKLSHKLSWGVVSYIAKGTGKLTADSSLPSEDKLNLLTPPSSLPSLPWVHILLLLCCFIPAQFVAFQIHHRL